MSTHRIVLATIQKHAAEAYLKLAQLESKERTIPATRRGSDHAFILTKQIKEAKAVVDAWDELVLRAVGDAIEDPS